MQQSLTFIYRDDVWVAERRHDLDLPADVNHVLIILDLLLPNGLDCHLEPEEETLISTKSSVTHSLCASCETVSLFPLR